MSAWSSIVRVSFAVAGLVAVSPPKGASVAGTVTLGMKVGADPTPLANVVVYLHMPGEFPPSRTPVMMAQEQAHFVPQILPILSGTRVKFQDNDPSPTDVYSPDYDQPNLHSIRSRQSKTHTFDYCTNLPCIYKMRSRSHPDMIGWVVVLPTPYFAVSDQNGEYRIDDVPPTDRMMIGVWYPKATSNPHPLILKAGQVVTGVNFIMSQ